jgi:DNA repair exonuclease SbcCD nuclease subunit
MSTDDADRFIVIADLQLQQGIRFEDACNALDYTTNYIEDNRIGNVFVLGDIYEHSNIVAGSIEEQVFAKWIKTLTKNGCDINILIGNHDIVDGKNNIFNAMKVLVGNNILVFSEPMMDVIGWGVWIPYIHKTMLTQAGQTYRQYFVDVATALVNRYIDVHGSRPILFTHCDIVGAEPEKGKLPMIDAPTIKDIEKLPIRACFAGHIHKHQSLSTKMPIIYAGSPIHTTFASENIGKGFLDVLDWHDDKVKEWKFVEIPSRKQWEISIDMNDPIVPVLEDFEGAMVKLKVLYDRGTYDAAFINNYVKTLSSHGAYHVSVVRVQRSVKQLQELKIDNDDASIIQQYLSDILKYDPDKVAHLTKIAEKYI